MIVRVTIVAETKQEPDTESLVSLSDAAQAAGVSPSEIGCMIRRGEVEDYGKMSTRRFVLLSEVLSALDRITQRGL